MILQFIDLYLKFILLSLFLQFILFGISERIFQAFHHFILFFRNSIINLIENLFNSTENEDNFEILFLSRILTPFIIALISLEYTMQLFYTLDPNLFAIRSFVFIAILFIIVNSVPNSIDYELIRKSSPNSFIIFLIKLVLFTSYILEFNYQQNGLTFIIDRLNFSINLDFFVLITTITLIPFSFVLGRLDHKPAQSIKEQPAK